MDRVKPTMEQRASRTQNMRKEKKSSLFPHCIGHEDRQGAYGTEERAVEVEASPVFC